MANSAEETIEIFILAKMSLEDVLLMIDKKYFTPSSFWRTTILNKYFTVISILATLLGNNEVKHKPQVTLRLLDDGKNSGEIARILKGRSVIESLRNNFVCHLNEHQISQNGFYNTMDDHLHKNVLTLKTIVQNIEKLIYEREGRASLQPLCLNACSNEKDIIFVSECLNNMHSCPLIRTCPTRKNLCSPVS